MDDKVIRPQFGDPKLVIDRIRGNYCRHEYVRLVYHDERVFCRSCNEEVDAFKVLINMAIAWEQVTYHQRELAEVSDRVETLKREESNVKSRLRAAHKLAAPEARSKIFFDEYLRRLNAAGTVSEVRDAHRWAADFKWLDPSHYELLKHATLRAEHRAEEYRQKNSRRNRAVRVLDGGKGV